MGNLPSLTHGNRHSGATPADPIITTPSYVTGRTKPYLQDLFAYNLKPSNTRRWRAGLGKAGRADYTGAPQFHNELWLGDSIMGGCTGLGQGTGADSTRFDRLNAPPLAYRKAMATKYGLPIAGTGMVRPIDGSHQDARITLGNGGSGVAQNLSAVGLAPGASFTFTPELPGDTVNVYYYDNFTDVVALKVAVNGATSGAGYTTVTGLGSAVWRYVTLSGISGLTAGSSVTVTNISGGNTVQVDFVEVLSSATGGIRVHNVALSGSMVGGSGYVNWGSTTVGGFAPMRELTDRVSLPFVPDVVHAGFGLFDAFTVGSETPQAEFLAGLQTIRNYFPKSDFVLHAFPTPLSLTDAKWLPYNRSVYAAADALDVPLFDFHDLLGGGAGAQALELHGDNTAHYLQPVYALYGRAVAALV